MRIKNEVGSAFRSLVILYPLSNSKQKLEGGSIQGVSPMSMKNMSLIYYIGAIICRTPVQ